MLYIKSFKLLDNHTVEPTMEVVVADGRTEIALLISSHLRECNCEESYIDLNLGTPIKEREITK